MSMNEAIRDLQNDRDHWKAEAERYKEFVRQFTAKEIDHPDIGYCLFCFGENTHTFGCLWANAKQALADGEKEKK